MSLDLRIPMGLMFLIVGAIFSIYGLVTRGSAIYAKSVNMNINLIWGVVMLVFGGAMFLLGRRWQRRPVEAVEGRRGPWGMAGTDLDRLFSFAGVEISWRPSQILEL